jgi:hypothetical protein
MPPITRLLTAVLALLLLGACKIQQTPREFIDRTGPGGERAQVLEHLLEERFAEMAAALEREEFAGAARALHPAPRVRLAGGSGAGTDVLEAALRAFPGPLGAPSLTRWDAIPELSPARLWFVVEFAQGAAATGYYEREGAAWLLTLLHLSPPEPGPDVPVEEPRDTVSR